VTVVFPTSVRLTTTCRQTEILGTIAGTLNVPPRIFLFNIVEMNDFLFTVTNRTTIYAVNIPSVTG